MGVTESAEFTTAYATHFLCKFNIRKGALATSGSNVGYYDIKAGFCDKSTFVMEHEVELAPLSGEFDMTPTANNLICDSGTCVKMAIRSCIVAATTQDNIGSYQMKIRVFPPDTVDQDTKPLLSMPATG